MNTHKNIFIVLLLFLVISNGYLRPQIPEKKPTWANIKFALYFGPREIENLLSDSITFSNTMQYFNPVRLSKVYLEMPIDGSISAELLQKLRNRFVQLNIKVAGALKPASKEKSICYNNSEFINRLEKSAKTLASIFDEILFDGLYTNCNCEKCIAGRGKLNLMDYRSKLLLEKSKKHIIDVAKMENTKVKVIIKFPNWYEAHRLSGYDVTKLASQFDGVIFGIETRASTTDIQHVPVYSGYVLQRWWSGINKEKWIGVSIDNEDMKGKKNEYLAQVLQAILGQSPEILLCSAGSLISSSYSDIYRAFCDLLSDLDRIAGIIKETPRGVPIYVPYGSEGEYNIFGYFGLIGIPLQPVAEFPNSSKIAIFTRNSLKDPNLASKLLNRLREGKDVFLTLELLLRLQNSEFANVLSQIEYGNGTVVGTDFRVKKDDVRQVVKAEKPISFPIVKTVNYPDIRLVSLIREDYDFAVLLQIPYLNGNIYVINMPDNYYDIIRIPSQVLNVIRYLFYKDLDVYLAGSGGVCLYLVGNKQYIIYNLNSFWVSLSLKFEKALPTIGWSELFKRKRLELSVDASDETKTGNASTNVYVALDPYDFAIIQAP